MGYMRPCGEADIPSSWADHKNRNPPSSEPGTDYAVPTGTPVQAAGTGTVVDVKPSNSYATGRYITVALDDGRTVRYLHLDHVAVDIGDVVYRGDVLGASGGSGNGSNAYYGPHVHVTLWPGAPWDAPTIDFEAHAGNEDPINFEEHEMIIIEALPDRGRALIGAGYYRKLKNSEELTAASQMATATLIGNARQYDVWKAVALQGEAANSSYDTLPPDDVATGTQTHPLVGPAWFGGFLLGLIGLVEVLRFVFDYVT
jgi:murein DD-endopeptidase MepM/ murein hydrolase activator NlpD